MGARAHVVDAWARRPCYGRMPIEIETKIKVESLQPMRARLCEIGATRVGDVLATNTFLDGRDRTLLKGDRGLRVRENRDVATGTTRHAVTYKGPRRAGPLKRREEREVEA